MRSWFRRCGPAGEKKDPGCLRMTCACACTLCASYPCAREPTRRRNMRVATVLLALALAAARPHDSASDRRALEALEARDQRAFELAIAPNRTRLQTIGKCSTIAAGGPPPPPPLPYPSSLQFSACAHSRVPRDVQLNTTTAIVARTSVRVISSVPTTRSAVWWAVWYAPRPTLVRGTRKLASPSSFSSCGPGLSRAV